MTFNRKGSKTSASCKQHVEDGTMNVRQYIRCSHGTCMALASFNVEGGQRPTFCKKHAEDSSAVNIRGDACWHDTCCMQEKGAFAVEGC